MSNPHADEMEKDEDEGGGITNRPLSREVEEQEQLPPRGQEKTSEDKP